jgi:hypothetical protein
MKNKKQLVRIRRSTGNAVVAAISDGKRQHPKTASIMHDHVAAATITHCRQVHCPNAACLVLSYRYTGWARKPPTPMVFGSKPLYLASSLFHGFCINPVISLAPCQRQQSFGINTTKPMSR